MPAKRQHPILPLKRENCPQSGPDAHSSVSSPSPSYLVVSKDLSGESLHVEVPAHEGDLTCGAEGTKIYFGFLLVGSVRSHGSLRSHGFHGSLFSQETHETHET